MRTDLTHAAALWFGAKARADAVVAWLREHGAPANALVSGGSGAERPIADNVTDAGRALNRRVEVALLR